MGRSAFATDKSLLYFDKVNSKMCICRPFSLFFLPAGSPMVTFVIGFFRLKAKKKWLLFCDPGQYEPYAAFQDTLMCKMVELARGSVCNELFLKGDNVLKVITLIFQVLITKLLKKSSK